MKIKTKFHNKSHTILIAEDSPTQALRLRRILEEEGFTTAVCSNGKEALSYLKKQRPTLLISDIVMPEMDGYELCSAIKKDEILREIPIILLTALTSPEDVIKGLQAGADSFVTKPYDQEFLLSRIQYILVNQEMRKKGVADADLTVSFMGQKHTITSNRMQIVDLLLSTYEHAILQNRELTKTQAALETLNKQLEYKVKQRTRKIDHLNSVLQSIRGVNQLIVREKNRGRLIQKACETLIAARDYHNSWIALINESGKLITTAEAGLGKEFMPLKRLLKGGTVVHCAREALKKSGVMFIEDPSTACAGCPLAKGSHARGAMAVRLEHSGKIFGILSISIPKNMVRDKEELSLFEEVAGDIAFGLLNIEVEVERNRAEEQLRKMMTELERSNTELQRFAYVASHDLQEPLRMISSFTQLLAKRYSNSFDSDADDFMHYIVDGATRMQALINGLLAYSRINTRGKGFTPTDCEEVLENAITNLHSMIEENGAEISHDQLPTILADDSQLEQLFQNLIGNAIKFRGRETPRIHISAREISDFTIQNAESALKDKEQKYKIQNGYVFSICDNGIGIAPEYHERIFTIFQRLHGRDEYDGTGIGLAICKRIIDRLGGEIWVESKEGNGSTFYFTIPHSNNNY